MKLYIAEKPSLGRAIADVLPKPHKKMDGCIQVGNGDYVSWCIGHLLEQAEPKAYNPDFAKWNEAHLPIVPQKWKLQAKANTKKQLGILKKLIIEADAIVHAGDPDREGQLLVDQVINFVGLKADKRSQVMRCLINDLNPSAVIRALSNLKPNSSFSPLSSSALARSRADWLYGINMTRAYTLQGQKVGFDGLLSVGRVQTPLLGLVVKRDLEIEDFEIKPHFEVFAEITARENDNSFFAKWQPSDACEPYMDSEGHVLLKSLVDNVIKRIKGEPALIRKVLNKTKKLSPPLPYNLSALQIDAATHYALNAKMVLDICQTLYERHKLITYPRSDNRYLPAEHFTERQEVLDAIASNDPALKPTIYAANKTLRSKAWNDKKISAHHAIIPTKRTLSNHSLNAMESKVYALIARQYIVQFYEKHEYRDRQLDIEIAGGMFIAKYRQTLVTGWKSVFKKPNKTNSNDEQNQNQNNEKENENDNKIASELNQKKVQNSSLPIVKVDDELNCIDGILLDKKTTPPKHFTDATLLSAMTGISRFVVDKDIRKILKETDGLGTEATRAGIIELLFKRNYLSRHGKQIHATTTGRALIDCLPQAATIPDMTAQWESLLEAISTKKSSYANFMDPMIDNLNMLISQSKNELPTNLRGLKTKTDDKRATNKPKRRTKKSNS